VLIRTHESRANDVCRLVEMIVPDLFGSYKRQ